VKRNVRRILVAAAAALLVFAVAGYFSAGSACAHDPRFACSPRSAEHAIEVPDPQKSWAFYGHLEGEQEDVYAIEVRRALSVSWSLLVDRRDSGNPARPAIVVRDAAGRERAHLDFNRATNFYKSFSREWYVTTTAATLALAPGSYTAQVRMRNGRASQRYTFAVGDDERFSVAEIPYVFGAIGRIRALHY